MLQINRLHNIALKLSKFTPHSEECYLDHPFDARNIHPIIDSACRRLFDDGHYPQATFEAYKALEELIKERSGIKDMIGVKLCIKVFDEENPLLIINDGTEEFDKKSQEGYKKIFVGVFSAIRNKRGHKVGISINEGIDDCLDNITMASMLARLVDGAKKN